MNLEYLFQDVFAQHSATISTLHCCHRLAACGWTNDEIRSQSQLIAFVMHAAFRSASVHATVQAVRTIQLGLPCLAFAAYLAVILHVGDVAAATIKDARP